MKKSNLLKKAVSVLLVASALAGCGSSASQTATTAAPAAAGTETSEAATEAASSESSAEPGTITMAMVSAWDSIIPFDTTSSYSDAVLDLIYDKLVYLKQDGTYEPRLADKWSMSDDNKVLTVHLNENAKWQDGEPVTADDVVFTMQVYNSPSAAVVRQNNVSPFAGFKEGDDSLQVKAVDEHTVEMTCAEPTNMDFLFFIKFRDIYILPKHLLGDTPYADIRNNSYWEKPIGSGPCIYESQISGERMEFKANKDYYLGAPDFDRLVFKKVQSSNLLSGLMSGDIDVLSGNSQIPLADWEAAKNTQGIVTKSVPTFAYQYMAMNTARDYLTEDVRHAISLAINRQVIVDQLLQGEARIAIGPLAEDHPYFDEKLLPIEYDPEKAKSMLEAAGWDSNRELQVLVSTGNEVREKSAILIQQNLQKIGIKTKIQTLDFPTLLTNARNGDYDLCFIGSAGSVDPSESVPNVTAGYMNNFAQLSDPTLGQIGESGAKEITFEARKKIYDQYQEELFKQMPMAFLYPTNDLFAYNEKLENVREGAIDYNINKNVWEWKVNK